MENKSIRWQDRSLLRVQWEPKGGNNQFYYQNEFCKSKLYDLGFILMYFSGKDTCKIFLTGNTVQWVYRSTSSTQYALQCLCI